MFWKWLIYEVVFCSFTALSKNVTQVRRSKEDDNKLCEEGWLHFQQKCYRRNEIATDVPWHAANYTCSNNHGGYLASIYSEEVLDFVITNVLLELNRPIWIGLHRGATDSKFSWADGSPVNYTNWMAGEPSYKGEYRDEKCVQIDRSDSYKWKVADCDFFHAYVCQKKTVPENLPLSGLSVETRIGIAVTVFLVLVLGAGIYYSRDRTKRYLLYFRRSIPPPVPTSRRPIYIIQSVGTQEEEIHTYEQVDYQLNNHDFEQRANDGLLETEISIGKHTDDFSKHCSQKNVMARDDDVRYEKMNFIGRFDNQRFKPSSESTQKLLKISNSSSSKLFSSQKAFSKEVDQYYVQMSCTKPVVSHAYSTPQIINDHQNPSIKAGLSIQKYNRSYEQMEPRENIYINVDNKKPDFENMKILPLLSVHSTTKCNNQTEFIDQEDSHSYKQMSFIDAFHSQSFQSGIHKAKSLPLISTDSCRDNCSMHCIHEGDKYKEPTSFLEHGKNQHFHQMLQDSKNHPQIPIDFSLNDISKQNEEKLFDQQQDDSSYQQMGYFDSNKVKAKSPSVISIHSLLGNQPMHCTQNDDNNYEPMGCLQPANNQRFEKPSQVTRILPDIPIKFSTNSISQQNTKKAFIDYEDDNCYQEMGYFELRKDKAKLPSEISIHSLINNHPMHSTQKDDNNYEPMGCFQPRNN